MDINNTKLIHNLHTIQHRIHTAALKANRKAEDITLIAVSKFHSANAVQNVMHAGQYVFGENRMQEAMQKFKPLKELHPQLKLHIIGPLQTNKVGDAVSLADSIQTLDRSKLLKALLQACEKQGRNPDLLIQINTGHEPQKAGIPPEEADRFIKECQRCFGAHIKGVMAIPPEHEDPRIHFKLLRSIAEHNGLAEISMGMSHDFEQAIEEGATMIRVGTAIFGARPHTLPA